MDNTALKERFNERKQDFMNCVDRLQESVDQEETSFVRDSVIKRYECAWETGWKLLKLWLSYQGVMTNSPRDVWKESFALQILDGDADIWTQAQKMRNLSVHTYDESIADEVYNFVCDDAIILFTALKHKVELWHIKN